MKIELMAKMKMAPQYKCRLCGRIFSSENKTEYKDSVTEAYDDIMAIAMNSKYHAPLYEVHVCGHFSETVGEWPHKKTKWYNEERIGLGDLIGYEEVNDNDQ